MKGGVEKKLDKIWEIIYSYGAERFGVKSGNLKLQKEPAHLKSRRQREIERLVKERRCLRKQWKKAAEAERKGLEALQGDLKQCLATLRRAECLRKQHKKKEAYMDDMTTITTTRACTKRLLDKLQKNIQWARMEIKPIKSGSISIVKGQLANERFHINEPVPTILEKPIESLGRWYSAELKDSKQVEQLKQDTISGLRQINSTALPGKLKL
ncbi:hypothetical protein D4764_04G0013090 [Takifugu flavidus]|uniref:Uncharacterized protein n=1 Tax=Takifugu flavidus TaxID=433684 RepID=A0A5C6N5A9_9TELE|nr:hypothetical protein D4764_04G0013090 [Takifugu flavidus]